MNSELEDFDSELEEMLEDLQTEAGDKFNRKIALKLLIKYNRDY